MRKLYYWYAALQVVTSFTVAGVAIYHGVKALDYLSDGVKGR